MKILKRVDKKLYFRILCHLAIIGIVILLAISSIKSNIEYMEDQQRQYEKYKVEQDSLLQLTRDRLDSMTVENKKLLVEQEKLTYKFDSISVEQEKIAQSYEKELDNIRRATVADNNKWFSAKLDSIRHYYDGK